MNEESLTRENESCNLKKMNAMLKFKMGKKSLNFWLVYENNLLINMVLGMMGIVKTHIHLVNVYFKL